MKKILIIRRLTSIGILASLIFVLSCTDDFVKIPPEYSIDSENFFNSEEDYYLALVAAYDLLATTYANAIVGEFASDNTLCGGENPTDVIGWQQIDDMIHTPINSNLRDIWNWMFAGVQRTNYFMEFKDNLDFEGKDVMVAEIRFLRAYYYFELVKWFGPVPLKKDARFSLGDVTSIPRSPVADVYAQIEEDLIAAADVLPVLPIEVGRATQGAAKSLLGKAYLYQDKFTQAAEVLEEVITDGNYSLAQNYNALFEFEGENGPESVFEVQYTDVEGAGFGCLQCVEGNVAVGFSGVRGYEGPDFTPGFSFNVPVQEAVDAFEPGDLRLGVTILDIEAWADSTGAVYTEGNEHTGYFNRKYLPRTRRAEAQADRNLTNPNNYRAIRYADVLLMAAEALNRGGISDTRAQEYVSLVRRRAFGDLNHDITVTGAALTDAILQERRVELMGEGHRFLTWYVPVKPLMKLLGLLPENMNCSPYPRRRLPFPTGYGNKTRIIKIQENG
jgi:hypothetical protein